MADLTTFEAFMDIDIRVGKIVDVEDFPKARKPAWKLWIDFGEELGVKKSSAQITEYYSKADLMNRLVLGVVNFPPRQVADFMSECLTLGVYDEAGAVRLVSVDGNPPLGGRMC
jgi:tRNA-binding protein